jgi:CBS domain-containing protein
MLCLVVLTSASSMVVPPLGTALRMFRAPWVGRVASPRPETVDVMRSAVHNSAESARLQETRTDRVSEHMSTNVITVRDDLPLRSASCFLVEHSISGAPVVNRETNKLVGMLSQTDLLYQAAGKARVPLNGVPNGMTATERYASNTLRMRKALAGDVASAMTTPVVSIAPRATIQEAAALLLRHHVSRLPVVDDDDKLVGIISTTDVMHLVTSHPDGCEIFLA